MVEVGDVVAPRKGASRGIVEFGQSPQRSIAGSLRHSSAQLCNYVISVQDTYSVQDITAHTGTVSEVPHLMHGPQSTSQARFLAIHLSVMAKH